MAIHVSQSHPPIHSRPLEERWSSCLNSSIGVCSWKKWLRFGFLFGFAKKLWFSVWFYKINRSFGFFGLVRRRRHLSFMPLWYDARNDVLPCSIGPTNCQPKWLRPRSAEIRHEEKYFDCWYYHAARWIVNETMWKPSPNRGSQFFENWTAENEFSVFEFWGRFGF